MTIDFDLEIVEIADKLKKTDGYLDCEKIIVDKVKKQLDRGMEDENIVRYLQYLAAYFDKKIMDNQCRTNCTNYRYAAAFVDTLLKMPYWKSWMKSIDL